MQKFTSALAKIAGVVFTGGGRLTGVVTGTAALTPPALAAGAAGTAALTVPGVRAGDLVTLEPPSTLEVGLVVVGIAVTANTVTITFLNPTAAAITSTSRTWAYRALRTS